MRAVYGLKGSVVTEFHDQGFGVKARTAGGAWILDV